MTKQARALRTRSLLITTAASLFNRDGYAATTFSRICSGAGISMGALTFHFRTKGDLAQAIETQAWSAVRTVVEETGRMPSGPLERLIELTLALTRLLEEDPMVRCAVRLSGDRHGDPGWRDLWLPLVTRLADEASATGQLGAGAKAEDVAHLANALVAGCETWLLRSDAADQACTTTRLRSVWRMVLSALAAEDGANWVGT